MRGTLYGVGLGPGDPELMTVKAIKVIEECAVVAIPLSTNEGKVALDIAKQMVPSIGNKTLLELSMPMTRDKVLLEESHQKAAERIIAVLDKGQSVAFLTIGDPSIYSTYSYVHDIVKAKNYPIEMIAGVPSFCAVAARLKISLGRGAESIHILPASYQGIDDGLNFSGTKILMKAGKSISALKTKLSANQQLDKAMMVVRCGMDDERVYRDFSKVDENSNYLSTIILKETKEES